MALVLLYTIIGDGIHALVAVSIEGESANTSHAPESFGGETAVFDSLRHLACTLTANEWSILCVNGLCKGCNSHCGHDKEPFEVHAYYLFSLGVYEACDLYAIIPAHC